MVDPAAHPMFRELPEGAHRDLAPLAGLIGTWSGEGVGREPGTTEDFPYAQTISFTPLPGQPVLGYSSRIYTPGSDELLATEVGFWRVSGDRSVELMLAHPIGIVEIYVGDLSPTATGFKVELGDNLTVRTAGAAPIERSERLYGLVEGDLAYVVETVLEGVADPTPQLSAKLSRSDG